MYFLFELDGPDGEHDHAGHDEHHAEVEQTHAPAAALVPVPAGTQLNVKVSSNLSAKIFNVGHL